MGTKQPRKSSRWIKAELSGIMPKVEMPCSLEVPVRPRIRWMERVVV